MTRPSKTVIAFATNMIPSATVFLSFITNAVRNSVVFAFNPLVLRCGHWPVYIRVRVKASVVHYNLEIIFDISSI